MKLLNPPCDIGETKFQFAKRCFVPTQVYPDGCTFQKLSVQNVIIKMLCGISHFSNSPFNMIPQNLKVSRAWNERLSV